MGKKNGTERRDLKIRVTANRRKENITEMLTKKRGGGG